MSLLEFIRTGCFGPIALGASRAEVFLFFRRPPNWSAESKTPDSARIWKYGDVEFYFDLGQLWMIFMDDFGVPRGEGDLELDAGPFYGAMPLNEATQVLQSERISYEIEIDEIGREMLSTSKTILAFDEDDKSEPSLISIYTKTRC